MLKYFLHKKLKSHFEFELYQIILFSFRKFHILTVIYKLFDFEKKYVLIKQNCLEKFRYQAIAVY